MVAKDTKDAKDTIVETNVSSFPNRYFNLRPFDDGHRPETCAHLPTQLSEHPWMIKQRQQRRHNNNHRHPQVYVHQQALPESIVDAAYERTVNTAKQHPAWGDYVTMEEIKAYWELDDADANSSERSKRNGNLTDDKGSSGSGSDSTTGSRSQPDPLAFTQTCRYQERNLVVALAAHFLRLSLGEGGKQPSALYYSSDLAVDDGRHDMTSTHPPPSPIPSLWNRSDLLENDDDGAAAAAHPHGVAVWGLAAEENSQVPYHLDYAEQIRYESNVIVPPLVAGTLQCTRAPMMGGDFLVTLQGIPHYEMHGYKGKKCSSLIPEKNDMICIPYQFNQLTCHLGDLPHASTKIEYIDRTGKEQNERRVIIGFNVFGQDAGPIVQEAPEHSERFRRKIQARRALVGVRKNNYTTTTGSPSISTHAKGGGLSLERLKQNKPLSKMLVLAKRQRIKQQYQEAQQRLASEIPNHLPATVQELMDRFYDSDDSFWPASPIDVQVYIHHQIQQGHFLIVNSSKDGESSVEYSPTDQHGLVCPLATVVMPESSTAH